MSPFQATASLQYMTSLAADDNTLDFITSSGHLALFLPFFKGNFVLDLFMAKLTGSSCTFRLPHRFDIGIKYKPIKPQMKNYYFHTHTWSSASSQVRDEDVEDISSLLSSVAVWKECMWTKTGHFWMNRFLTGSRALKPPATRVRNAKK